MSKLRNESREILLALSLTMSVSAAGSVGCGRSDDVSTGRSSLSQVTSPADRPPAAGNVQLQTVSCGQWDRILAAQSGKIIVVDTWATWCLPCTEEFPSLVALHKKYSPQGVVCMSVSVDSPDAQASALGFLERQQAEFANYLIDDTSDAWIDKWNIKGIPVVLVFQTDGTLAKKFDKDDPDNQFTYADVENLIVELLTSASK